MKPNFQLILTEASFLYKLFEDLYCGKEEFTVVNRKTIHLRLGSIRDEALKGMKNESQ